MRSKEVLISSLCTYQQWNPYQQIANLIYITIKFKYRMLSTSREAQQSLCERIIGSLSKVIIDIESDEILEQMRNDKALYEFKIGHIVQILEKQFSYMEDVEALVDENDMLKKNVLVLENEVIQQKSLFTQSIDNIETNAHRVLKEKDNEISKLNKKLRESNLELEQLQRELEDSKKKLNNFSNTNKYLQEQNIKMKQNMKFSQQQLHDYQKSLHSTELTLTNSSHAQDRILKELKLQHTEEIQEFERAIKKMQGDMLIIKTQWQKKCNDTEKNLKNYYEHKIFELEDRKTKEMLEHIESMKEGKETIVIKTDETMLNNKINMLKNQHDEEIMKLKNELQQYERLYNVMKDELSSKSIQLDKSIKTNEQTQQQLRITKEQLESFSKRSVKQNEKIRVILKEHEKQQQNYHTEISSLNKLIKTLKNQIEQSTQTISSHEKTIKNLRDGSQHQQQSTNKLYQELKFKEVTLQEALKNYDEISHKFKKSEAKNMELNDQVAESHKKNIEISNQLVTIKKQRNRKSLIHVEALARVNIQVNAMKQIFKMLKDDIQDNLRHLKENIVNKRVNEVLDFVSDAIKQKYEIKTKDKISELLDEIQNNRERENVEFEELSKQKHNLKRQLEEMEMCLTQKNNHIDQLTHQHSTISHQFQTFKTETSTLLENERNKYYRLEQDYMHIERQHHLNLEESKDEIKESIKKLTHKWGFEISRLEEQNKKKEDQLMMLSDHTKQLVKQYEQVCSQEQLNRQQCRKYRKKYEEHKSKSEEQIEDLLNRLEKENKQKIELDKEIRSIKTQLYHYNPTTNGSSQGLYRNNKNAESSPQMPIEAPTSSRQQELSELKQLVAKTYEMTGGYQKQKPEKDFRKKIHY